MRKQYSIFFKWIIIISSFLGVILSLNIISNFQSGVKALMYFTIQSNIWIGIVSLWLLIIMKKEEKTGQVLRKRYQYVIKYIFTVSISLTGLVFCVFLAPTAKGYSPWTMNSVLTHVIVPFISMLDFFVDDYEITYKNKEMIYTLFPPLYYLLFSLMCYYKNFTFSDGNNYPYFFLNFGSEVGLFGINNGILGTFYWIVILMIIVLLFGYIYKELHKKNHQY